MPNRSFSANSYKYGFNGKEKDDETGTQDYGNRIYNPSLARFLSTDPIGKDFPWYTPYQFAGNSPIVNIDLDGLEDVSIHKKKDKSESMVIKYNSDDVRLILYNCTPEKRIKYTKEGSDKTKKTAQFEGPSKDAEEKLFKQLNPSLISLIKREDAKTGPSPSRGETSGVIPAPLEVENTTPIEPHPVVAPEPAPANKTIKYLNFDLNIAREDLEAFAKDKKGAKEYIQSLKKEFQAMGYDEVNFGKVNIVEKRWNAEQKDVYEKNGNKNEVGVAPVVTKTGEKVTK